MCFSVARKADRPCPWSGDRSLAANGTLFANAYVAAPVCAPSRSCLASGREYDKAGVACNFCNDFPVETEKTFYNQLQAAGYHTMVSPKKKTPYLSGGSFHPDFGTAGRRHTSLGGVRCEMSHGCAEILGAVVKSKWLTFGTVPGESRVHQRCEGGTHLCVVVRFVPIGYRPCNPAPQCAPVPVRASFTHCAQLETRNIRLLCGPKAQNTPAPASPVPIVPPTTPPPFRRAKPISNAGALLPRRRSRGKMTSPKNRSRESMASFTGSSWGFRMGSEPRGKWTCSLRSRSRTNRMGSSSTTPL